MQINEPNLQFERQYHAMLSHAFVQYCSIAFPFNAIQMIYYHLSAQQNEIKMIFLLFSCSNRCRNVKKKTKKKLSETRQFGNGKCVQ